VKLGLVFNSLVLVIAGLLGLTIVYTERFVPMEFLDSLNLAIPPLNRILLFSISSILGGVFGMLSASFETPMLGITSSVSSVVALSSILWIAIASQMKEKIVIAFIVILVLVSLEVFLSIYRSFKLLVIKSRWRG